MPDVQFLGIGTISQAKQNMRFVDYIWARGKRGKLRPYVTKIAVNYDVMTCYSNGIPKLTFLHS